MLNNLQRKKYFLILEHLQTEKTSKEIALILDNEPKQVNRIIRIMISKKLVIETKRQGKNCSFVAILTVSAAKKLIGDIVPPKEVKHKPYKKRKEPNKPSEKRDPPKHINPPWFIITTALQGRYLRIEEERRLI